MNGVSAAWGWLALMLLATLAGCAGPSRDRTATPPSAVPPAATPPASGSRQPGRPPGDASRVPPAGSLNDPAHVRELLASLSPRGWRLLGPIAVDDAGGEPDLVLAQPDGPIARAGRVPVRLLTLLSGRRVLEEGHAAILMQAEIDCTRGMIRPLARERFADRQALELIQRSELGNSPAVRIAPDMVVAQLQRQVCRR